MAKQSDAVSILIVDDHALVREGVVEILSTVDEFTIVGEAGDATEGIAMAGKHRPDVLLLDVEMGDSDVTATVTRIRESSPDTRIIILSMHDDPTLIRVLIAQGVRGYIVKNANRHELIAAIRCSIISTQVVLSTSLSLLSADPRTESPAQQHRVLTSREIEILALVADALSNAQVARRLLITEATVKRHMRVIFGKLGAVSRIDAVNRAIALGALEPPSSIRHRFAFSAI